MSLYDKLILFFLFYVSVLPANGPQITGEKKQYQIGDELNLNCSSGTSYPASVLNWYINETPVGSLIVYLKIFTRSSKNNSLRPKWFIKNNYGTLIFYILIFEAFIT